MRICGPTDPRLMSLALMLLNFPLYAVSFPLPVQCLSQNLSHSLEVVMHSLFLISSLSSAFRPEADGPIVPPPISHSQEQHLYLPFRRDVSRLYFPVVRGLPEFLALLAACQTGLVFTAFLFAFERRSYPIGPPTLPDPLVHLFALSRQPSLTAESSPNVRSQAS